jgi:hypothetical protein
MTASRNFPAGGVKEPRAVGKLPGRPIPQIKDAQAGGRLRRLLAEAGVVLDVWTRGRRQPVFGASIRSAAFRRARSIRVDGTWATKAYILYWNGPVGDDVLPSHSNITGTTPPNARGFWTDDPCPTDLLPFLPEPCMTVGRAAGQVTPADPVPIAAGMARIDVGPTLNNAFGRPVGAVPRGKNHCPMPDMAAAGLVWNAASLHAGLASAKGDTKGTRMSFAGMKTTRDRDMAIVRLALAGN